MVLDTALLRETPRASCGCIIIFYFIKTKKKGRNLGQKTACEVVVGWLVYCNYERGPLAALAQ